MPMKSGEEMELKFSSPLPGPKIVGKIDLAQFKKKATQKVAKKIFKPFSGGITLGEILKEKGIKLVA